MRVALAGDHAGFELKGQIAAEITSLGHEVIDLGAHAIDPADDYPDFGERVATALLDDEADRGIVVCGSGVGVCIAVNKHPGLRAGICHDTYSAAQGVEHDDMNVLCLGERVVGPALAATITRAFLGAKYSGEERHARRLAKVIEIERRWLRES